MHQFWRWILPALAGLVCLVLAPHALAQTPTPSDDRLANLAIHVWPEYDQPSVYVQIDGEVAAKDKFPRDVSILIPTGAQLNATAYVGTDGNLLVTDTPKSKDLGDGFTQITFPVPAPKFRVEYYYNPLTGSPDKTMTFVYKGVQPADNVLLEVQQPLKATNFKTEPEAVVKTKDPDGFVLHQFNYATLEADKPVSIKVSYTKTDPNPSITPQPVQNPAPASTLNAPAAGGGNTAQFIGAALVALALALAALGGFYWWSRNRQEPAMASASAASPRRRSRRSGGGSSGSGSNSGSSRTAGSGGFCPQCGRSLSVADNFCPKCGTPRRKS